jgi:hypothetical protein
MATVTAPEVVRPPEATIGPVEERELPAAAPLRRILGPGAAIGIVDYLSRLVADVLLVGYLKDSPRWTESRLYLTVAWGMLIFGCLVLLAGFDQPLTLVVLAAALSGVVMFIYSGLLIAINRRFLPAPLRIRGVRLAALVWAVGLFGVVSVVVIIDQFGELF